MNTDSVLREQLIAQLKGHAHMSFDEAVAKFPSKDINTFPPHVDYTFWHIIEHIRRTQADILDFIKNKHYKEPKWPEDYWPKKSDKATKAQFDVSVDLVKRDLEEGIKIAKNPKIDLTGPIPYGTGQSYLRELLLIADHNAYHIGEFAILRQVVGAWPGKR